MEERDAVAAEGKKMHTWIWIGAWPAGAEGGWGGAARWGDGADAAALGKGERRGPPVNRPKLTMAEEGGSPAKLPLK